MKVEVALNDAKRGVELLFSEELSKELSNHLKEFGFKQGFREPLKWYATQHPAYNNYAEDLKKALLKGEAFTSVHIQPSFEPTEANIDHNKFSYVTISFNKNAKKEQESYVVFDSFKTVATAIAKRYGKNKYEAAFNGVDVSARNYKKKARALLSEGKVITDILPTQSGKDRFTNEHGVYTQETAGDRYVKIEIPIPTTAKYRATIKTVLGEDKLYRSAFSTNKDFGDVSGGSSPITENDPTYDSWPSAIQGAAKKLIKQMIADLNSPDSILNNEKKKRDLISKALKAVREYLSTEYNIQDNEPELEEETTKLTPKNSSLEQFNGKDFEIIEKSQEVSPLYHGTCIPFKRFEKQFLGSITGDIPSQFGYHFTPSKELSEQLFANEPYKDSYEDCRVFIVGIKVKKTLRTTESTLVKKVLRWGVEQKIITERPEELLKTLELPYYNVERDQEPSISNVLGSGKWLNKGKLIINYEVLTIRYLNEVLRPVGIDSIQYMNEIEWPQEQRYDWIVFDVSQIIYKKEKYVGKTEENKTKKQNEKSYREQLIDLGFNGFFSVQDAFDKPYVVIDLQARWDDTHQHFSEKHEEPAAEQIQRWKTVLEALKGEKDKASKEQKAVLKEKISNKTIEVSHIKTLIENESIAFQQDIINQIIERAKKLGHSLKDEEQIANFSDTISEGLFDERMIESYFKRTIPEIADQIIQEFFTPLEKHPKTSKTNKLSEFSTFLDKHKKIDSQIENGKLKKQFEQLGTEAFKELAKVLELTDFTIEYTKWSKEFSGILMLNGEHPLGQKISLRFGTDELEDDVHTVYATIVLPVEEYSPKNSISFSPKYFEESTKIKQQIDQLVKDYQDRKQKATKSDNIESKDTEISKTVAVDIESKGKEIPNVIVPRTTKEPFISGSLFIKDTKKIQKASPNLLLLNDSELSEATAIELFELSQMPHPTDYGFKIKRGTLLKEWQARGEEVFEELGFPTDLAYPYVNIHGGYTSVYPLSRILTSKGVDWWAVVEHYRPIAGTTTAIFHIEQKLRVLEDARLETINPKTNKPKAKEKEKYRKLTWDINGLLESKLQIEKYRRSPPKKPKSKEESTKSNSNKSTSKDIRNKFSLEEFIEYGSIGFDKLSAYQTSVVRKAKQVMEQAIQLGYAIPYDYGKGKGKYTTTKKADEMSFRDIFTNVYNNIHIDKLLPEARERNQAVKNKFLFTPEKDIPKQSMKDCEGENQAGDATMFSCVNVMVLGKGYQGWNYTPFLGLQIILNQINAPLAEFVKQLEKVTSEDWSWLNGNLGAEMDLYTKKPRKESYYISTTATINDLLTDLIASNFTEVKHVFEGFLMKLGVHPDDVISELEAQSTAQAEPQNTKQSTPKNDYLDRVVATMHEKYAKGERPTKGYIQKLATELNVPNMGMMWEAAELSWLLWYKQIYRESIPFEERLEKMIYFWNKLQPTYAYSDSSKEIYKQYSTPCPIGAIIAQYTEMEAAQWIFEPSAGNGLLLVGADPRKTHVNEIDHSRMVSLKFQGFNKYTNLNAAKPFLEEMEKKYDVMVTNSPFARWDDDKFDKERIIRKYFNSHVGLEKHIRLEHLMSGLGLYTMKDTGKAAIIIMGHVYFGEDGFIAKYRPFFNWLYRNYHVNDVINMNSFKLYNKQGAIEKTMLILVGGRKSEPKGVAPTQKEAAHLYDMVNSFSELWTRVKPFTEYTLDNIIKQLEIAIAA
ncbi:MAG: hypothetical protein JKY51_03420 [Opitutaceae bacterium]|nr:hypothetical protein [Opitutaceae bacterium]